MRNLGIIARRELRSYFDSPIAYIVIVAFLGVSGWMFFSGFFVMDQAEMRTFFAPSPFSPSMLLVVLAPALSMRLIAEERKSGTIELLTTLPVRDWEVVVGKFLAAFAILASALAITLVYGITASFLGDLDWGPVVSGYLGMLLFSGALLAIGLLCSTWTENQIVAFIVSFLICAALYFVYWLQAYLPEWLASITEFISVGYHLDNMSRGVADSRDIIYYLSLIIGSLFLAVRSLERQHA